MRSRKTNICRASTLGLLLACSTPKVTVATPDQTPDKQFILQQVTLEERQNGRITWTGTAKRMDGDLSSNDVQDAILTHQPQNPGEMVFVLHSPRGHLALDEGYSTFEEVEIHDTKGGILYAGFVRFDEKSDIITAAGPIKFVAQNIVAHAVSGVVSMKDGSMEIAGPVTGVYTPPPRSPSQKF